MGAFLDKPKTDKHNETGSGNGLRYALSSMQGWRIEMEDAHCAVLGLPHGLKEWSFFAVFDGHAGARVSAHCAEHLLHSITQSEEFRNVASKFQEAINGSDSMTELVKRGIREGFLQLDAKMRDMPEVASGEDKSGSTAVCTLISPQHIFIANCGDSRAVLSQSGIVMFSTQDHKPINPTEKERIQNAGGSVMIQRVNGSLAVSRALGDYEYKQVEGKGPCEQLVSPEPEIFVEGRNGSDEFLVLACDGVWDVMTNDDLCDFIRSRLRITDNIETICNQVIDICLYKGSRDNMSIVLVTFPGAPTISQDSIQKEKKLEEVLEKRVKELVDSYNAELEVAQLVQILQDEDIQDLPPGGGIFAKRDFIESIYNHLRPPRPNTADSENGSTGSGSL